MVSPTQLYWRYHSLPLRQRWTLLGLVLDWGQMTPICITKKADTAKLNGPRTLADKRWVGPVKFLCVIMFDISKIRPKSVLSPVKAQKFSWCLKKAIIAADNDSLPVQQQAIIWTNAALLSVGLLGMYFSEIWIKIHKVSVRRMNFKMSANWCPFCLGLNVLTHWGRDKMAAISQTTLSNDFFRMKMFEFRLRFHWNLFPRPQLTIFHHWSRYWLGAGQATSHYLNQWLLLYWRIYASLGLNELRCLMLLEMFEC